MRQNFKYLRLSSEDEMLAQNQRDESNSITNQRVLLNGYIDQHPELGTFDELIDDGYSGTNFNRPGIKRLLELVEQDMVGTILLKDLSRLGRNFLDVGFYLEITFPAHGVRVIAVNDGYDSAEHIEGTGGVSFALQNLKNEFYSIDLSRKIRSSLEVQKQRGEYHGHLPYGYVRGTRKHSVLIDEYAASVVRLIFRMAAEEKLNTRQISVWLNKWEIPSPSVYRTEKSGNRSRVAQYWSAQAVCDIIQRRSYTGDSELYKSHAITLGSTKVKKIPRHEREIVLNTHEAIVSRETFQAAQKAILRHTSKHEIAPSALKGYLYCGCCGRKLKRYSVTDHRFACENRLSIPDKDCGFVICSAEDVEQNILDTLHKLIQVADVQVQNAKMQHEKNQAELLALQRALESKNSRITSLKNQKLKLYEKMANGKLSVDDYRKEKSAVTEVEKKIIEEKTALECRIEELKKALLQPDDSKISPYRGIEKLTPEVTKELIRRVVIYSDKHIEIEFTFQDCINK